ncbi:MAG: lysophospholipid acyltransferase family protein [Pseudomonadaceae bacterium]|nr:lysophospholipid acyltransferase family protein [Pseudomonadaceae bacterium]
MALERCSILAHITGKLFLRLSRWRVHGEAPNSSHVVIIAAPHTTNWDFVYLLAAAWSLRVRIHWLGKKELFRFPFGGIMRALGGIAVDRSQNNDLVAELAETYAQRPAFALVIPPSGSRSRAKHWRSGFYWIASSAGADIVCGYLDYPKRTAGLGLTFKPSGDVSVDMDAIRAFYEPINGKYPERETPTRLREEASAPE